MDTKHIEMMKDSAKTGAIVTSGALQYRKIKNGEVNSSEVGSTILKETIQGTIGTVAVMSAINCNRGILSKLAILGVGIAGIYGVEAVSEKIKIEKGVENA